MIGTLEARITYLFYDPLDNEPPLAYLQASPVHQPNIPALVVKRLSMFHRQHAVDIKAPCAIGLTSHDHKIL
jgi:hypothetical protein